MSDLERLDELCRQWCAVQDRALAGHMNAAAHLLAERARALVPGAAVLVLEDSDQGDWLTLVEVEDAAGNALPEPSDLDQGEASCLYQALADSVAGITFRTRDRRYTTQYELTIGQTEAPAPPVEVIVVRDPDASDDVSVLLDGYPAPEASVVCIDAGAGWDVADWEAARDEALAGASPAAARLIAAAFNNPPGARYITGFQPGE